MRAGLFGGSFDPPHIGHIHVAQRALLAVDEVWFLPAATPPHKMGRNLAPFHHRLQMLKIATQDQPRFKVVDIETRLPPPSYTLQTVKQLRRLHPDVSFSLVVGTDTLSDLPTWFKAAELLSLVDVVAVERKGYDESRVREVLEAAFGTDVCRRLMAGVLRGEVVDVSSTEVRAALMRGEDVENLLPNGVANYIKRNGLYGWKRQ